MCLVYVCVYTCEKHNCVVHKCVVHKCVVHMCIVYTCVVHMCAVYMFYEKTCLMLIYDSEIITEPVSVSTFAGFSF